MNIYLVGGAVRDSLLNLPITERDWLVVGATPEQLVSQGYRQVGKDFPVFLHPVSGEEYALARTERKSGQGHTGFTCYAAPNVTLEEDLLRRDLTINAIARRADGKLFDPYHGVQDLESRILRHVSDAFEEDPLRVLRVARFAARFAPLGFSIAPDTATLMYQMTHRGELSALPPERVWKETEKALLSQSPGTYFQVLRDCGALAVLFPEIERLFSIPVPANWHAKIDIGTHTLMALTVAAQLSPAVEVRFAALCHHVGGEMAPQVCRLPQDDHSSVAVKGVEQFCQRLRVPNPIRDLAKLAAEYHHCIHTAQRLHPAVLLKLFDAIDVWRKPQRLEQMIMISEAGARSRPGFENHPYPPGDYLRCACRVASSLSAKEVVASGLQGVAVGDELKRRRQSALAEWKKTGACDDHEAR